MGIWPHLPETRLLLGDVEGYSGLNLSRRPFLTSVQYGF
jgi:hypothetical protein